MGETNERAEMVEVRLPKLSTAMGNASQMVKGLAKFGESAVAVELYSNRRHWPYSEDSGAAMFSPNGADIFTHFQLASHYMYEQESVRLKPDAMDKLVAAWLAYRAEHPAEPKE